jgi:hypothetical protein
MISRISARTRACIFLGGDIDQRISHRRVKRRVKRDILAARGRHAVHD